MLGGHFDFLRLGRISDCLFEFTRSADDPKWIDVEDRR
jgi:hypothetical protein